MSLYKSTEYSDNFLQIFESRCCKVEKGKLFLSNCPDEHVTSKRRLSARITFPLKKGLQGNSKMKSATSIKILALSGLIVLASACSSTTASTTDKRLTVGLVQKEIKVGVSSLKVAQTLGSPNIVKKSPETKR